MVKKPLLLFPQPVKADQRILLRSGFGGNSNKTPTREQQIERIEGKFNLLFDALEKRRAFLQQHVAGATPEMVLVLEFVGSVNNFFTAVKKVRELEFLAEYEDTFESDNDFYRTAEDGGRQDIDVSGQLFLVMTNQEALRQLQKLWEHFKNNTWEGTQTGKSAHGLARFQDVFKALKDIRPYSVQDRLKDTGFADYIAENETLENAIVPFEVELFYRTEPFAQTGSLEQMETLLGKHQGSIVDGSEIILHDIQYHAFVAKAPIGAFKDLSESSHVAFLKCEHVMHFRPVGQVAGGTPSPEENLPEMEVLKNKPSALPPVAALLDGYPLSNHTAVRGKLIVDDPDDYLSRYEAPDMRHGTAMASLIVNGDLDDKQHEPLQRSLYVRPIMCPDARDSERKEHIPTNRLPIDLIHRAVKRMFDGEGGEDPVAPNVKVINLSIGDPARPFHINVSAWAKLLDWLSVKYNVLFVVSVGNWTEHITLNIAQNEFQELSDRRKQAPIFEAIKHSNLQARKILTPSEAINGISVGSSYSDQGLNLGPSANILLFGNSTLIAPYSRVGLGYRKAIKPDILHAGGRLPYRVDIRFSNHAKTTLAVPPFSYAAGGPGQRVATPGNSGELTKTAYTSGTSNSAALTTRLAVQLHEVLEKINRELTPGSQIPEKYFSVLLKALLVHGASWDGSANILCHVLSKDPQIPRNVIKDRICGYLGYGATDADKILYCTDQRVTLLGFGEIKKDARHDYSFPLPNVLNKKAYNKRLAVTLAWFSPLNFHTATYRQAELYVDNMAYNRKRRPDKPFHATHANAGFRIARKGAVQHHILEDDEVGYYSDDENLKITVNCKEDAGGLKGQLVKYGLAVTLEVRENVPVPIYQEIEQRIQVQTRTKV